MKKNRLSIAIVLTVSFGSGWWLWTESQPDPQVEAVKALLPKDISKVPEEKRRETFQKVREEIKKLTPQQRNEVFKERREGMVNRMREYSKLPPKEQVAFLDKEIDRMEEMKKMWQKRKKERESKQKSENATKNSDQKQGRGPRGGKDLSNAEKQNRRRNRLDSTTPEERALFTKFIQDLKKRRAERGLPPFPGRGFGPPPQRSAA